MDVLPSLKMCVNKIVETFQTEERQSYNDGSKLYPKWTTEHTALMLRHSIRNVIDNMLPRNAIWTATHRKFLAKVNEVATRLNETLVRDINADVPMQEILGAPNSVDFVRLKLKEFKARVDQEEAESRTKQLEMAGDTGRTLMEWRTLPPEEWKVSGASVLAHYEEHNGSGAPIANIIINKERIGVNSLRGCFASVSTNDLFWQAKPKAVGEYVLDVDLWKDKMPALLWTVRAQQGYKRMSRRLSVRHGKPVYGITLLSTWGGKVYLVHGYPKTVKEATNDGYERHEIVLKKTDKDEEIS